MTAPTPVNGGAMKTRRLHGRTLAKDALNMQNLTPEQLERAKLAKAELQRRIQQMIASGYDAGAVKQAMRDILEDWG
jgi:hypothetical protein